MSLSDNTSAGNKGQPAGQPIPPVDEIRAFLQQRPQELPRARTDADSGRLMYGWSVPAQRDFIRTWIRAKGATLDFEGWLDLLNSLYHGQSVEEKTITGMLLSRFPAFRRRLAVERLDQLEHWLGQLVGWKEVDSTCQSVFSVDDLNANWEGWQLLLRRLSADENINKRRAALVLLVLPVRGQEGHFFTLAIELLERLHHEKDKRISKAVSWLLREAASQHGEGVREFMSTHQASLPAFVIREVTTKLDTGKKR